LQKSKGLTSKVVLVLGCIEGLVPFIDSKETQAEQRETIREQRRLFYVAMTRPTDVLVLSSFTSIDSHLAFKIGARTRPGGGMARTIASRFLAELGPSAPAAKVGTVWEACGYQ
jgi:DNA helicase-2/ATP-dependent DNA helicase PcrA